MDVYEALYTTRAMRRVKPDPIPIEVQQKILDAAVRAPTGGNMQNWRFLLVDDPEILRQLAPLYQDALGKLWVSIYKDALDRAWMAIESRLSALRRTTARAPRRRTTSSRRKQRARR